MPRISFVVAALMALSVGALAQEPLPSGKAGAPLSSPSGTLPTAEIAAKEVPATSLDKVKANPAAQYVLLKTIVGRSLGVVKARALPVEAGGYNLLKYCWTAPNVLGDWAEQAGLAGAMTARALETLSWARDLERAGYPGPEIAEAIGRYEAMLVSTGFTEAGRVRALEGFQADLEAMNLRLPGVSKVFARERCQRQANSFMLNFDTAPPDGTTRFVPWVLHQLCEAQKLDPDDPALCNYWQTGRRDGQMAFAGEMVYRVQWPDGTVANGRFDPDEQRLAGKVTLRERPLDKAK